MDIELQRRTADLRSVADIRLTSLEDGPGRGQRLLIARNAHGVAFEVAVDKGFDIAGLSFRGTNIGWHSPVQMAFPTHDPGSEEGWGFLRNFDGFMVTCGLDHYSRPLAVDVSHYQHPHVTTRTMPQHGRISTEKARLLGYGVDRETLDIVCEGSVRQASVFGETLELRRKITLPVFGSDLTVEDTVINHAFRPSDHAFMYHLNFGYPFLDDTLAIGGLPDPFLEELRAVPCKPNDDFAQKVDVVDSRITPHDSRVSLRNDRCGVTISLGYSQDSLPKLAVWRAYQSGVFALGIEPRTDLRPAHGTFLQPGESRSYSLVLGFASI
ncbi:aldose 1-epimerase family protein [Ensifer adhaerens]|uniref:DUF4432 family protein n=1 Tax=Ensifer adhaerens TaxID=106592 RepID=UPI001CBF8E4F|nr:DUF4432 family protein [Ensifer adhaerens]MBZ7924973.1 aldose 1-epimerase family protein [Ensifer adhaerens]UAX95820.1 aldose 1-epimerase family protein [Ensifer adhaerens]UAY04839.1 aldose 1-epimerase family protein [Ensifer adhaerens]UAY10271.1 aldose 1-epimerase family protein [Ensifer adhaerens]